MLLSIGMIVKNEEEYLDRCLTALKPLLEAVDSELIIADTGSTDRTVEIAKKHTDKVYYFEWINDFSAARNFTLKKSRGEWFMFMDADEILQSCDELIDFFKSGEHRKYGNGSIKIRSYADKANFRLYTDTVHIRLAKKYDDVAFVNKIHEALSPFHEPIKMFNTIADHYGYFFRSNGEVTELAREKSKRNLEPLMKSLESGNVEFSVYKEIADCYQLIDEDEKALEYLNMGLKRLDHKFIAIVQYYSNKATLLFDMKRFEEVIETCDEYFGEGNPSYSETLASDFDIYAMRGDAYYRLENYDKAYESLVSFFKVYNAYKNNKLNTLDLLYNSIKVRENNVRYIYTIMFECCIKTERFNTAAEYFKHFPIKDYLDDTDYMFNHLYQRVAIMEHIGYKGIKKLMTQLDESNRKQLIRILRWKTFYSQRIEELLEVLSGISADDPLLSDVVKIYYSHFIHDDLTYENIVQFIGKYGALWNVDILCIMLTHDMDISSYLTATDFNAKSCIHVLYTDYNEYLFLLEAFDINRLSPSALRNVVSVFGRVMVEADLDKVKRIDFTRFFEKYGEAAVRWKKEFPSEENIPGDIQAGLIVYSITSARSAKDYKLCISEMKRLIKACPEFAPFIKDYQKMLKNEIQPFRSVQPEIMEMAVQVKQNIRNMISSGNIAAAESTLTELEKLCPTDPEIQIIKNEIFNLKS